MKINLISEWGNVVSNVRNNIVFEHRNQAYGAYFIRREYPRTIFFSLFVTVSVIALGVASLKLYSYLSDKIIEVIVPPVDDPLVTTIYDITPDVLPPTKIDPPKTPPPPKGSMFVAPVVSDDKDTITETQPFNPDLKPGKPNGVDTIDDGDIIIDDPGTGTAVMIVEKDPPPFTHVEEMPEFIGGERAMLMFINDKVKYPKIELENNVTGTVYASFVVDKTGNITNVKIERGVKGGPNFNKEVERVINLMPKWKPGKQNGVAVPVQFYLPVKFETR